MTRPGLVRADTVDLQDTENPTASNHQKHPQPNGIAPHQAAQVQHAMEERHSEEQSLDNVWRDQGEEDAGANGEQEKTNGEEDHGEAGESEGESEDDMMDRISSSPSIDDEDIDFEFVYALHTFVATVEGQANATKGDTMVLLDDSNSYWWLVRVVKDSSIGYLPAEHIETPTERLARLNKHRNIDLSATMLSDNSEKTRNPLKKAMRRRNAKTVQFAAPTYVEASDYDYSSDEEGETTESYINGAQAAAGTQQATTEEAAAVEQKEAPAEVRTSTSSNRASFDREQAAMAASALAAAGVTDDEPQLSPKLIDKTEAAPLKSRKGTPRNADSFLKDDGSETRKITLTPGLLREDNAPLKSPTESTRTASMESLTKVSTFESDGKKDNEKKKKGGMLSGFFKSKKKDKKSKDSGNDLDEKVSLDIVRSSSTSSDKNSFTDRTANGQAAQNAAQGRMQQTASTPAAQQQAQPESGQVFLAELPGSEVAQEMATGQESSIRAPPKPLTGILKTSSDKPKKAKKAKKRMMLDDFDTPAEECRNPFEDDEDDDDDEEGGRSGSRTFMHGTEIVHIPMPGEGDKEDSEDDDDDDDSEDDDEEEEGPGGLTSPLRAAEPITNTTAAAAAAATTPTPETTLERKPSNPTDRAATTTPTITSPTPGGANPSRTTTPLRNLINPTDSPIPAHLSPPPLTTAPSPTASTPSSQQQPWNDHSLRAWLEDGREVRDMLVMIHDKSGVTPVADNHPLMAGLYVEQRKGVQDMMGQLDGLLGAYLNRKGVRY